MVIRERLASDVPELAQLYKQFWGEDSCIETMQNQFDKISKNGTHVVLSAVEEERLVGSIMGVKRMRQNIEQDWKELKTYNEEKE